VSADGEQRARRAAAEAAAALVEPGMTIGLGSGRAVWAVVEVLGARGGVRAAVASERTGELARAAGIEIVELDGGAPLDLALDGADEVDRRLGLIKGGGGALLREKIVISAARRFVVVAEEAKRVERLGERTRLPVEVVRFGWRDTRRRLAALVDDPVLRMDGDDPYRTDEGHLILDCEIPAEADPAELDTGLQCVPGVVESGLFLGLAERALLGRADGSVDVLEA
jgi:ribose 5-phosphate isomerase A